METPQQIRQKRIRLLAFPLFVLALTGGDSTFSWGSLQLLFILIVYNCQSTGSKSSRRGRHVLWILPSILLATGYWIGLRSEDGLYHQIGVICCLTGIGSLLGWFPFPRGESLVRTEETSFTLLIETVLPTIIAAIFLFQCVDSGSWTEHELAILAVVSLISLAMCGLRLCGELTVPHRCRLSILTILCNANIATVLMGWQILHPDRSWSASSNIFSADNLFLAILFIETFAILLLLWECRVGERKNAETINTLLQGKLTDCFSRGSFAVILGVLILSGFPFFPGSWWRFKLLAALILPYEQSLITKLSEPHHGFVVLAMSYAVCSLIVSIGQLKVLPAMLKVESAQCQPPPIQAPH